MNAENAHSFVSLSQTFPLADTHNYALTCSLCTFPVNEPKKGYYHIKHTLQHSCDRNILLICKKRSSEWIQIRKRNKQYFYGKYGLCRYFTSSIQRPCGRGQNRCTFAHSNEEKILWNQDKEGVFNIADFIQEQSNTSSTSNNIIITFANSYPCPMKFEEDTLIYIDTKPGSNGIPIEIKPRSKLKTLPLCHNNNLCTNDNCMKPHSDVERAFWNIEKQTKKLRKELVELLNDISSKKESSDIVEQKPENATDDVHLYVYKFICSTCWYATCKQIIASSDGMLCNNNLHDWRSERIVVASQSGKKPLLIKPLPSVAIRSPDSFKYHMCYKVRHTGKCTLTNCKYAHTTEEGEIWEWQARHRGKIGGFIHFMGFIAHTLYLVVMFIRN